MSGKIKLITAVLILISAFTLLSTPLYAQSIVGSWVTGVGKPTTPRPGQGLQGVLTQAAAITALLKPGTAWGAGYYNRLDTEISNGYWQTGTWGGSSDGNVYWCTYLIIDSFRLAGFQGLSKSSPFPAVLGMQNWWATQGPSLGYQYLDYERDHHILTQVQPGYPMFMWGATSGQNQHVALVKSISITADGSGTITVYQSNSTKTDGTYPVDNWQIRNTVYPVHGFGGIAAVPPAVTINP